MISLIIVSRRSTNPVWSSSTPAGNEKEEGRAAVRTIQGDGSPGRGNGTPLSPVQILAACIMLCIMGLPRHLEWSTLTILSFVSTNIVYAP